MNSGPIDIRPVENKRDLLRFIKLPERIYRGNPYWVPPLLVERKEFFNPRKNPFFKYAEVALFLAWRGGVPMGRISAHISKTHNEFHDEKTGLFGFFETIDDYAVAEKLLRTAVDWVRGKGMDRLRGPMSFTTNHETGLLLDAFDISPMIMMTYNPEYYPPFLDRFGFTKAMDLYAYYTDEHHPMPERVMRVMERAKKRSGCKLRPIDLKNFDREIAVVKEVYNGAWAKNWGFVPLSDEEFDFAARDLKQIADPELILIAEDGDRAVGFSMTLPDFNQVLIRLNGRLLPFGMLKLFWHTKVRRIINRARVLTMGIIPEYRKRGLDNIFAYETFTRAIKQGYPSGEMSWVLENNEMMNRIAETLSFRRYKTYRVYDYELGDSG